MFDFERLRKRRLDMGLTLQEVADVVGISMSAVQKYEKGKIKNIYISTIELFSKALHCSPLYLLGWINTPNVSTTEADKLKNLSPENQEKVKEYMNLLSIAEKNNST